MEIHAPEKPILTIKEAAVHLSIVTVGILIALSLEGAVEYVHHRRVVREAREIMRQEIEANRTELRRAMSHIKDKQLKEMQDDIKLVTSIVKGEKPTPRMMIGYSTASLRSAGHSTAELMGAFAYMDYREVGQWAAVYDLQADFLRVQAAGLAEGTGAFSFLIGRDLLTTPVGQLESEADMLRRASGSLVVTSQFGRDLLLAYDSVLAEKK